ncbi:MAG: hypothetical protein BAJALOKI1v1_1000013 [Promethearchaeota archaeon]|nr:MAG: hypothetical protein BAJALOKI1v1_1000013 [Candidatus Lokiarchaeota archaeon]
MRGHDKRRRLKMETEQEIEIQLKKEDFLRFHPTKQHI